MDLADLEDMSGGCEGKNCSLASRLREDCRTQDCYWEEPMFGLIELVCVTMVYIPLMLFGLLGNVLTILVVWLRPHMRSSTYLYLSSMAVSDLLILLLLPLDLYKLWRPRPWPLGDLACKLTMFLSECCTFSTILHITFLSLERYLAVCWPITAKTVVTRRRTRVIIGCLWLGAAVSASPVLIMVGVEDVGGEEFGLNQWREDGGREGEQGGVMMSGAERGGAVMALLDARLEEVKLAEKEKEERGADFTDFIWLDDRNSRSREGAEWKQGDIKDKTEEAEEPNEEERKMEFEKDQQNKKKEDEGGGREERADASRGGEVDRRECRCTHYAISSGLLSAMMILSNLYFLVPLCILGLVYTLIGRTLWLRPKSSRRDQSHRSTVKMLGVIVLAFVLCWLPFHVGRTILSLSLGSGVERQDAYLNATSHADANTGALEKVRTKRQFHNGTTYEVPNRTEVTGGPQKVKQSPGPLTTTTIAYTATPTDLYADVALNAPLNSTHSHPDTHMYFLYYLSQYFNLVSSVLFYLSAAVNPLLYNLMSARYRLAVHSLIHKHPHTHTHTHRLRTLTARHSTTTL
ncbi:growth hormone secretagogue receptor type 1-like isoform X2 [Poeciliopsis prolifica]|uniref:growth hormone secretagogue receptor type 1-like isoform X2 n=1 Tax=Poeciliopsis prolifica TaxID=188132 RepID=UPI002412F55D|nr:growth hormone secretagogue receptor type 1-like isoform X2 [Poeciliopsis prolifica]